jgi:hypothetical protein
VGRNGFQNVDKSKFVEDLLPAIQAELKWKGTTLYEVENTLLQNVFSMI